LFGKDFIPHVAADGEAEQEEDGEDPSRFLSGAEGDDEQGQQEIEVFFDAEGPCVGKGAFSCEVEAEVLGEGEEAPERWQVAAFGEGGDGKIQDQDGEIGGQYAKGTFDIKFSKGNGLVPCDLCEELAADQVAAEDEEEVDAGPAPAPEAIIEAGRVAE
jgi:hypothetical protein